MGEGWVGVLPLPFQREALEAVRYPERMTFVISPV
jgi:hypothetical protein